MTNAPTTRAGYAASEWLNSPECIELMKRVGLMLYTSMNKRERWLASRFFGGPAASVAWRNFLARLIRESTDVELATDIRIYFNTRHAGGDPITQADVSCAIRLLKDG